MYIEQLLFESLRRCVLATLDALLFLYHGLTKVQVFGCFN